MLKDLNESVIHPVQSSIITPKFLSRKFEQFKAILHKKLAQLSSISNLLPTGTPPALTGVQGGERKVSSAKAGGEALHKDAKVLGKVYSSNIPTTKPIITSAGPVTSTIVTSIPIPKQISKEIIIGSSAGGSSASKSKDVGDSSAIKDKGKTLMVKKAEAEDEMEKVIII